MHPFTLHLLSSASPGVLSESRFCRFPISRETALTDKRANPLTAIFRGTHSEENVKKNVEFMCRLQEKNLCGVLAPHEENETRVWRRSIESS